MSRRELQLLTTKLHIPRPRANLVARPHLIARLDEGATRPLTLISAPPGFGKTTLLAEWIAQTRTRVAWLALDAEDNDPTRFWMYVIGALQTLDAQIGVEPVELLRVPTPPPLESILTLLVNQLAARADSLVLVLDDYHVITAPPLHAALAFLIEHLPASLHLILITRADPPLPLARMRARDHLCEIRADDLRFTADQAAQFLQQGMGLDLAAEEIAALEARTEGWIAGLQLAALSMRGRADHAEFVRAFSGSHRYIVSYLVEEVLHRQPEAIQTFLVQTSILARMNADLGVAVTGQADAGAILKQLEQNNLFIIALDERAEWYRYHHLFAQSLQSRVPPERVAELHRRASEWFEQNGFLDDALNHTLAIADYERAANLMERAGAMLLNRGDHVTLQAWLDRLPAESVRARLWLLLYRATQLIFVHQLEIAEDNLRHAETLVATQVSETQSVWTGEIATLRGYIALNRNEHAACIALLQNALELLPPARVRSRGAALLYLAIARMGLGQLATAKDLLDQAQRLANQSGDILTAWSALLYRAIADAAQGTLRQAEQNLYQAVELAQKHNTDYLPTTGRYHLEVAKLRYEWNDLTSAEFHLQECITRMELGHLPRVLTLARVLQARIALSRDDRTGAHAAIAQADQLVRRFALPSGYVGPVAAMQAQIALAEENISGAMQALRASGWAEDAPVNYANRTRDLSAARVLIAQNDWARAQNLLEQLHASTQAAGNASDLIAVLAQRARLDWARGNGDLARNLLTQALTLAEPEGFIRTFVDAGAPMQLLIANLAEQIEKSARDESARRLGIYVDKLLAAFPTPQSETPNQKSEMVELLSAREKEVLRLIAQGASNRDIAEQLVIALTTVKKHTTNIFGKLGVSTRTQAIARAREVGLL